jgi:hypothetical protein
MLEWAALPAMSFWRFPWTANDRCRPNRNFDRRSCRKLNERMNLQFRFETFNLLNSVTWAQPSNSLFQTNGSYTGSAGVITSASTASRQLQFALKLVFRCMRSFLYHSQAVPARPRDECFLYSDGQKK